MKVLLELFLFISIMLPIFHMLNAIPKRHNKENEENKEVFEKPMTILVPCFNEEAILKNTVEGMLRINYKNFECVFINDGSEDSTLEYLKNLLLATEINALYSKKLKSTKVRGIYNSMIYPNFYIIDKENGGKGDSLNAGIDFALNDIVVTIDADCVLKKDALDHINQKFKKGITVAASGVIHILQSYKLSKDSANLGLQLPAVLRIQTIEYIKSCYTYKASLCKMNALPVISGAFGVFDRDILLKLGGYRDSVGEDIDITLRIQFYLDNYREKEIAFVPEAICYTEAPENWHELIKQRTRWQKAFIDCLITYRRYFICDAFKKNLSFFMIFDGFLVGTFSTLIYSSSYLLLIAGLFISGYKMVYAYYTISLFIHLMYNIISLNISKFFKISFAKKDLFRLIKTVLFDVIIYRFFVIIFILKGTIGYFINKNLWDKVKRSGRDYKVLKNEGASS